MYIYAIQNLKNNKLYIGKTKNAIKHRWCEHCYDYKNVLYQSRIYNSIRKHGVECFFIHELKYIEKYDPFLLDKLEKLYIKKYDTTNPALGYNISEGGCGGDNYSNHPNKEWCNDRVKQGLRNGKKPNRDYLKDPVKRKAWLKKISDTAKETAKKRSAEVLSEIKRKSKETKTKNGTLPNSENQRKINSESNKGRVVKKSTRNKLSKSLKGRIFSNEHKENISKSKRGLLNK